MRSFSKVLAAAALFAALWFAGSVTDFRPARPAAPDRETARRHAPPPRIDPASLPPETVWTFSDGGAETTYAVALDELYLPSAPHADRLQKLPPQKSLRSLVETAASLGARTGQEPRLVLYPLDEPRTEYSRRIVTPQVLVETDNLDAVRASSSSLGLSGWHTPDYAPGCALALTGGDPAQPLRAAAALSRIAHVISAAPLLAVQHAKRAAYVPNDPLFSKQWHLANTGQQSGVAGMDINVTSVWPAIDGSGVNIGIVDDSLQITHPDISPNAAPDGHYDWNGGDTDPSPDVTQDDHGTAVGGLAAARGDNGIGVSGVAPKATLYGLRLIAEATTSQQDADAMLWKNDVIQVKNNSWGPSDYTPQTLDPASTLWKSAVANGTANGRGGLGTVYVWSAGNGKDLGDQGAKDGYSTNINVLPVAAVDNTGVSAYFSEGGAHVVVSAPGDSNPGIVTTDLVGSNGYNPTSGVSELTDQNYTQTFAGTSAAAPIVTGVVALMLDANPALGWRDVKEIFLRTSRKLESSSSDWVTRDGGQPALPPIKHHPFYGGGLVDAQAAVALATSWTPLAAAASATQSASGSALAIPDAGAAVIIPFTPGNGPVLRVEHIELTVNITHPYRGDLEIKLISPSGTVSTLVTPTLDDYGSNYSNWTFTSVRHWGESSAGVWQLSIRDAFARQTGTYNSATLKIYGVAPAGPEITLDPADTLAAVGEDVTLTAAANGTGLAYQWSRNGTAVSGATSDTLVLSGITLAKAGSYACTITDSNRVPATTASARVAVYDTAPRNVLVGNNATFTSPAVVAGSFDSLRWYYNDVPLADSSRISGSAASVLSVSGFTSADAGSYVLKVTLGDITVAAGSVDASVRPPPDVTVPASQSVRLGATPVLSLSSAGGPYTYVYTGLPKGVSYNSSTGALTGRPAKTGTYTVSLLVSDSSGSYVSRTVILTVQPVPAGLIGTFGGYVGRDPSINGDLGGYISLTTTSKGSFSGKLTLGGTTYSVKGQLDGPADGPGIVNLYVLRSGQSALLLQLSLPADNTEGSGTIGTAAISVWRNPWSKTVPANAYAAKYNFALEPPDGDSWPAGYSVGTVNVTTAGSASWTLQPADGTPALKGTGFISADGTMPLFARVAAPSGSFVGFLSLPSSSAPSAPVSGDVSWLRGSTTSTAYANAAGFGPVDLSPHGGRYSAPASGTLMLGLPPGTANARLEFDGLDLGALSYALSPFTFTVASGNKVVLPSPNPAAVKLTATASTGLFSGTFVLADPNPLNTSVIVKRTAKFSGVLLKNEGVGAGFFVLPALPGSGEGTRSGSVLFSGAQ